MPLDFAYTQDTDDTFPPWPDNELSQTEATPEEKSNLDIAIDLLRLKSRLTKHEDDIRLQMVLLLKEMKWRIKNRAELKNWVEKNLSVSMPGKSISWGEARRLINIGSFDDPKAALAAERAKDNAKHKNQRDKRAGRPAQTPDQAIEGNLKTAVNRLYDKQFSITGEDERAWRKQKCGWGAQSLKVCKVRPQDIIADQRAVSTELIDDQLRIRELNPIKAFRNHLLLRSRKECIEIVQGLIADLAIAPCELERKSTQLPLFYDDVIEPQLELDV